MVGSAVEERSVLDYRTGLTVYKPERCYKGYTVYAPYGSSYVYMINMECRVVHMWTVGVEASKETGVTMGTTWYYKYLKNGHLVANVNGFGLKEMDWDSKVVWRYYLPSAHHDLCRMRNGNTMILFADRVKDEKVSRMSFSDDRIREVTPEGGTVWEWHASEHFEEFNFSDEAKRLIYEKGGDWLHTNTVDVLPDGNAILNSRNANMVWIIDKKTGEVVWTWGQQEGGLVGAHHPSLLENGNILIYDNGGSGGYPTRHRFYTRLVEVNPKTGEIVWEFSYTCPHAWFPDRYRVRFLSLAWGSAQRLPNGNTLSLDTHAGRLFEITYDKELVWEYLNPYFAHNLEGGKMRTEKGVYRCYRVALEDAPKEVQRYYFD